MPATAQKSDAKNDASLASGSKHIPEGYTFMNHKTIVSKKGLEELDDLLEQGENRDPQCHNMYIYNDYSAYGLLNLLEERFKNFHQLIAKAKWDELYPSLEALTLFFDMGGDGWAMADDGELVKETNKVYGSIVVALLRGLAAQGRLDETEFPSLGEFLKNVTAFGDIMKGLDCSDNYAKVCKAIGRRLFEGKEEEREELKKNRVQEWLESLDSENRKEVEKAMNGEDDDDDEEDDEEDDVSWYKDANLKDENKKASDLNHTTVWKSYKKYGVPGVPFRGPTKWDLSKWTKAEKAPFSFDREGGSDDDF